MLKKILSIFFVFSISITFSFVKKDTLSNKSRVNPNPKVSENLKINAKFSKLDAQIAFNEAFSSKNVSGAIKPFSSFSSKIKEEITNTIDLKAEAIKLFNGQMKYVDKLIGTELVQLPIGIKGSTTDGFVAEMAIVTAKINSQYIEFTAFARIETQFLGVHLYFAAENLKLSHEGGVIGDWKLHLLGNESLPQLGNKMQMTILGGEFNKKNGTINSESFIEFDCDGFKSFSFRTDIRIGRSIALPVDAAGNVIAHNKDLSTDKELAIGSPKYVGALIQVTASGWNEMLIELDLPSFEVKGLKGWTFKVKKAVFDMSDIRNAPNIPFPQQYTTAGLFPNGDIKAWRGFYAGELSVKMPQQFNDKKTGKQTEFQALDLIIDNNGVSGKFAAYKLLEFGDASGWQIKLDYAGVAIELGKVKAAKILGYIKPSATDSFLEVNGTFNELSYILSVKLKGKSKMKMFNGALAFEPNSWVKLEIITESNKFKASAFLNGRMAFKGKAYPDDDTKTTATTPLTPVPSQTDSDVTSVLTNAQDSVTQYVNAVGGYLDSNVPSVVKDREFRKKLADLIKEPFAMITDFVEKQAGSFAQEIKDKDKKEDDEDEKKRLAAEKEFYEFDGIIFQNLALKSYELPYIQADYFGYPSDCKFGNFPLSFQNIHLINPKPNEVGIAFKMKLNFMESADISGDAGLQIIGKFHNETFQSYKFDRIAIDEVGIDIEKSGFSLKGNVKVFDRDTIYGEGFKGSLVLEMKNLDIRGQAKAMFAKKDFSYWFVDFQIDNDSTSGKFGIERIEGGINYRMKRVDGAMLANIATSKYEPDATMGLGFRAGAKAKFGSKTSFKAKIFVEIQYNSTGGMNRLYMLGEGAMMSGENDGDGPKSLTQTWASYNNIFDGPEKAEMNAALANGNMLTISKRTHPVSEIAKDGKIGLFVSIERDFVKQSFDGLFELYLKLEGIKGSGENNKFGMVHMYSSPQKSYLHVGTPLDKLGAIFKLAGYDVQVRAYFMTGDVIPSQIPPHERIVQILGPGILNDNRNLSLLNDAKGFAFGLDFTIKFGEDFGCFYAYLEAGGGFDISHRLLTGIGCKGRPGLVGNDGWYSMGQVYAYLWGEAGVRIKVMGFEKEIKIVELGVGAMLRGEFPNPTYMQGHVGIYYNVMGGMIKGRFNYKVELGEKCEFVGLSNPLGISVISEVSPNNETNVDVFKKPQVAFNYAMLTPFTVTDLNNNVKNVRINLKKYELFDGTTPITGEITWTDNNRKANFTSTDILPPNKLISAKVEVALEERSGNSWVPLQGGDGTSTERKEFSFTTGKAPEYIPIDNVKYSYPVISANNFYPQEHQNVYIKLKQGQDYLFDGSVQNWTLKGEIAQADQLKTQANLTYNATSNKISFPYTNVAINNSYGLKLMAYPQGNAPAVAGALTNDTNTGSISTADSNTTSYQTITNNNANATNNTNANKLFLEYNFITSQHETFTAKMNSIQKTGDTDEAPQADTRIIYFNTANYENFNLGEIAGSQYTNGFALISSEAVVDDVYFTQDIFPLLYQTLPLDGNIGITNRNTNILGTVPIKSNDIHPLYLTYLHTDSNNQQLKRSLPYRYNISLFYKTDFIDLQYKLANRYLAGNIDQIGYNRFKYLIDATFPVIRIGNYKIKYKYTLNENEFNREVITTYNRNF